MATEREQVKTIVADFKMGVFGLGDAIEKLEAVLGIDDGATIEEILTEGENDPLDQIVNEFDAEYDLDFDADGRDDEFDDDDPDEFDVDDQEPSGGQVSA